MMNTALLETLIHAAAAVFKQIPGVGGVIEFYDRQELAAQWRLIFARFADVDAKLAALQALTAIPPKQLYDFTFQFLNAQPEAKRTFIAEILQQLPQTLRRKTQATQHFGEAKDLNETAFFLDLIPDHRPHDHAGQPLAHRPRWTLQYPLGRGGFGEVWLAEHAHLPEQDAIKFCHSKSDLQFLRREFHTLKLLQTELSTHPNIVKLKDLNLDENKPPYWLAFEYIAGGTLFDVMQQRRLAWREALDLITKITEGVAAAHALQIVHRDLKPTNILLTPDGIPKVADFGLGKVLHGQSTTHFAAGTLGYASPEQLAGEKAEASDDVYALAVIFWQLASHTQHAPHYLREALANSRLPNTAKHLLLDCLEQPRSARPKDASAFLLRLKQLPPGLSQSRGFGDTPSRSRASAASCPSQAGATLCGRAASPRSTSRSGSQGTGASSAKSACPITP